MYSWDDIKNERNKRKHGISFETAKLVFDDPLHVTRRDRVQNGEWRWQTIGMVNVEGLLLLIHTLCETEDGGEYIRIISARRTTKSEKRASSACDVKPPSQVLGHGVVLNKAGSWFDSRYIRSRSSSREWQKGSGDSTGQDGIVD